MENFPYRTGLIAFTIITVQMSSAACSDSTIAYHTHSVEESNREGYITVDENLHLYYRLVGNGADTLIVPGESWYDDRIESLAENRTLVLYDMRSRGLSDYQPDREKVGLGYDLRDLVTLVDSLGIQRFSYIGNSYLALLGSLFASRHKERVKSMILVGFLEIPFEEGPASAAPDVASDSLFFVPMRKQGESSYQHCIHWLETHIWPALSPTDKSQIHFNADPCRHENERPDKLLDTLGRILRSIDSWDWHDEAFDVYCPVLIVHGMQDAIPMAWAEFWTRRFPNARLLRIRGAGHMPWVDKPDVLPLFDQFLSGEWPGDAEIIPG